MQTIEHVSVNNDTKNKVQALQVRKRDGRVVSYNPNRVVRAVERAEKDARGSKSDLGEVIAERVETALTKRYEGLTVDIPTIQDLVERELMKSSAKDVASKYIGFRALRDAEREQETNVIARLTRLARKDKDIVNENANKDARTFSTQRDLTAGTVAKTEGLKMLPKHVANAHLKGDIHFHDLDYSPYTSMSNCMLIDFESMLAKGFVMGNAEIKTPRSIQTATAQVSQILANVASQQFGLR